MSARRRAAIYVRISRDKREQAGVKRQETECRALAAMLGWDVVVVHVDNDREASSGKKRPGYEALLDDMRSGRVDGVIGWHSDRIYRRPDELEELILIADEHGVLFSAVKVGNIDLSTASGRLVARLLGAVSKHEVELKGERQSSQLRQRAMAGLPAGGGSRPFGWLPDKMTKDPVEAAIVEQAASLILAGHSITGVTEWLHTTGVPTVSGKPWHPTVVKRMLSAPRLAGLAQHQGQIVGAGKWQPILDETTWRRVLALVTYAGPRRPRGRVAVLAGLIYCGRCGFELVTYHQSRPGAAPVRSYGCRTRYMPGRKGYQKSCGAMTVKAEWVEDDVAERILARLSRPESAQRMATAAAGLAAGPDETVSELTSAEQRLADLGRDYADELIGRTEFLAARDRLAERIDRLTGDIGVPEIRVPFADPVALAGWWEAASLLERQALARQHIARIKVGPHQGRRSEYDRGRLDIDWR